MGQILLPYVACVTRQASRSFLSSHAGISGGGCDPGRPSMAMLLLRSLESPSDVLAENSYDWISDDAKKCCAVACCNGESRPLKRRYDLLPRPTLVLGGSLIAIHKVT